MSPLSLFTAVSMSCQHGVVVVEPGHLYHVACPTVKGEIFFQYSEGLPSGTALSTT